LSAVVGFGRTLIKRGYSSAMSAVLHTPASLSDYLRDEVLREAEPAYVAA
jgi:hypothetical protein